MVRRCSASAAAITHAPKNRAPLEAVPLGASVSSSVPSVSLSTPHNSIMVPPTGAAAQSGASIMAAASEALGTAASLLVNVAAGAPLKLLAAMSVAVLITVCAVPNICLTGTSAMSESYEFGVG